jgi:hypothetical protein
MLLNFLPILLNQSFSLTHFSRGDRNLLLFPLLLVVTTRFLIITLGVFVCLLFAVIMRFPLQSSAKHAKHRFLINGNFLINKYVYSKYEFLLLFRNFGTAKGRVALPSTQASRSSTIPKAKYFIILRRDGKFFWVLRLIQVMVRTMGSSGE